MFSPIEYKSPFIQILNVHDTYWIMVSNVRGESHVDNVVYIYDSKRSSKVDFTIKQLIRSFMRPVVDILHLYSVGVDLQHRYPGNY